VGGVRVEPEVAVRRLRRARAHMGVTFRQPPTRRPYGVEAVLADDSGDGFSPTEGPTSRPR
jgi:hypothetical protein